MEPKQKTDVYHDDFDFMNIDVTAMPRDTPKIDRIKRWQFEHKKTCRHIHVSDCIRSALKDRHISDMTKVRIVKTFCFALKLNLRVIHANHVHLPESVRIMRVHLKNKHVSVAQCIVNATSLSDCIKVSAQHTLILQALFSTLFELTKLGKLPKAPPRFKPKLVCRKSMLSQTTTLVCETKSRKEQKKHSHNQQLLMGLRHTLESKDQKEIK